jgi:hypothetical protein
MPEDDDERASLLSVWEDAFRDGYESKAAFRRGPCTEAAALCRNFVHAGRYSARRAPVAQWIEQRFLNRTRNPCRPPVPTRRTPLCHGRARARSRMPVATQTVEHSFWPFTRRAQNLKAPESAPSTSTLENLQSGRVKKAPACGAFASPLPDSNRRPPPYHVLLAATGRNPRPRFWVTSAVFEAGRFAAGCHPLQPRGSIKAPSSVVVAGRMAGTALLVTSRCLLRRPVVWVPSRSVRVAMRLQRAIEAQSAGRHAQLDACNLCEEGRARCRRSDSRRRRPSRTTTGRRPTSPARKSRRRLLAGLDKCGEPSEG